MSQSSSACALASDPVGKYWVGATQLVWCRSPFMCGSLHWGQPSSPDIEELAHALDLTRHPAMSKQIDVFMDTSAVERVRWDPFVQLRDFVRGRLVEWSACIRRQAVVVPAGLIGALIAGMVPLLGMTYPMRYVLDYGSALDWLGWSEQPEALRTIDDVVHLANRARGIPSIVRHLRAWLETSLPVATIDTAAAALGASGRSLQRQLREASTSFTAELHAARVRIACALLVDTDDKVDAIARAVGMSSASQLSAVFRRIIGVTPMQYRLQSSQSAR